MSKSRATHEKIGDLVRLFERGGRYHANFQHDGRQRRVSLHTTSMKEARRRAVRLEAQLLDGTWNLPSKATAITEGLDRYIEHLETDRKRPKTLAKARLVRRRVQELAKQRRARTMADIDLQFVDAYRTWRAGEIVPRTGKAPDPTTIHNETVVIRQIVNFALSRRLINQDPLRGLKLRKPKRKAQPWWTPEEVEAILATAKGPNRAALVTLADSGMRAGELRHLTHDDINFDQGLIHIRGKDDWQPKSGDERAVPMTPRVRDILQQQPRHCRWVFTASPSKKYPKGDHQVSLTRLLEYLKRVLKRLGLRGHLHSFRHSFISGAIVKGVPAELIMRWVGHVDRKTMELYLHFADRVSRAAMDQLAASTPPPPSPTKQEGQG